MCVKALKANTWSYVCVWNTHSSIQMREVLLPSKQLCGGSGSRVYGRSIYGLSDSLWIPFFLFSYIQKHYNSHPINIMVYIYIYTLWLSNIAMEAMAHLQMILVMICHSKASFFTKEYLPFFVHLYPNHDHEISQEKSPCFNSHLSSAQNPSIIPLNPAWLSSGFPVLGLL